VITNKEIEFKCAISEEKYYELISKYNLKNVVFLQTNFYFDDENLTLLSDKLVLRIRKKNDVYKLTMKSQIEDACYERHYLIPTTKAEELLKYGFNVDEYFDVPLFVKHRATLENYRASFSYLDGRMFFDRSVYNGIIDYEIEYEALDANHGKEQFFMFLKLENIEFLPSRKKSDRALKKEK